MKFEQKKVFKWFAVLLTAAVVVCGGGLRAGAQPQVGTVLWTYDSGGPIHTSPALAPDGTVYVGTFSGLCAITNNGTIASNKWTFPSSGSAAIGLDGTIYSASLDGNLYAINPNGSQQWSYPVQSDWSSPAIGFDNTIYVIGSNYLYAVRANGTLKWRSVVEGTANYTSPVIGPDGSIYAASWESGRLYAYAPDGNLKWSRETQGPPSDSPAIDSNGNILLSSTFLYAFAPGGEPVWFTPTNIFTGFSPVVGNAGIIYLKDFNTRRLDALDASGKFLWSALQDGAHTVPTVAAIAAMGTAFYCYSNTLAALGPGGTSQWSFTATPEYSSPANGSPTIGPDGTIYVTFGSKLYAVYGTNGLADSSWPMYRQNARHTGKIERPFLSQAKKRSDGNFQFQLLSQLGGTNVIEASTNLVNWVALTNVVVTNVPMEIVDPGGGQGRFYRARTE